MNMLKTNIIIVLSLAFCSLANLNAVGQTDWKLNTRLDYYTTETEAEVLLVVPEQEQKKGFNLILSLDGKLLFGGDTLATESILRFRFPVNKQSKLPGKLMAWISGNELDLELITTLVFRKPKVHAVKIDRLTGGLLVNDLTFFPFGFYCYSPVQEDLAADEVVKGFNMMSPYQKIEGDTRAERQAYMDRCARLGMKVHYNLLSVAGGGGVGSGRATGQSPEEKWQLLLEEIHAFKDHPALLAWYISDEPTGHGESPDSLKVVYDFIKSVDPYHPISIVFMAPMQARKYADAMDIVMADPYPVPNQPIKIVGTVAHNLKQEFLAEKAGWMVPQAFGGSEHWRREPTLRELRAMTWMSIVEGMSGIQYFVRHGKNGFPKSTATWGECGRIALEISEIMPFLTKGIPVEGITSTTKGLRISMHEYQGDLLVIAVNEDNDPKGLRIDMGFDLAGSNITVLFENRTLSDEGNELIDLIDGYGRRVYRLSGYRRTVTQEWNLLLDPGFENSSSPGVPSACYASVGQDKGASAFLDTRLVKEGQHSLRLTTPETGKGMALSFFPVRLSSGSGYTLSVWAKMDTTAHIPVKPTFWQRLFKKNLYTGTHFTLSIGSFAEEEFRLTGEWACYKLRFHLPDKGSEAISGNVRLSLADQGIAWFDQMELYADPVISYGLNEESGRFEVTASTREDHSELRYTLNGIEPTSSSPKLVDAIGLTETATFSVGLFDQDERIAWSAKSFFIHNGIGKQIEYRQGYAGRYTAGGEYGLVDGIRGTRDYLDGLWQGFMGHDLVATIDLENPTPVSQVIVGCLQDTRSWIFMPESIQVSASLDGNEYLLLGRLTTDVSLRASGAIKKDFSIECVESKFRYVRIQAKNIGLCPDWHNGKGKAAFLFVDEIIIQ